MEFCTVPRNNLLRIKLLNFLLLISLLEPLPFSRKLLTDQEDGLGFEC